MAAPPFVPFQKNRKPGASEKACPTCQGSGNVDTHVCKTCHHAGVVPKEWKQGDGPVKPGNPVKMGDQAKPPAAQAKPGTPAASAKKPMPGGPKGGD
jgi:DnaJ-class molecular chaperone